MADRREREKLFLEWLEKFAENRGKSSTFYRCRASLRAAVDKLGRRPERCRDNIVVRSLEWVQCKVPENTNERQFFQQLRNFPMSEGRRSTTNVFPLLASVGLIEMLRGLIKKDGDFGMCCFELRSRVLGSKIVRLSQKRIEETIALNPHIASDAETAPLGYLGQTEDYAVDLRNFLCGLSLLRSMISIFGDDMRRCGLLPTDGVYLTLTREQLPEYNTEMQMGPFRGTTAAARDRMARHIDVLLGVDQTSPTSPADTACEKQLKTLACDFFPIFTTGLSPTALAELRSNRGVGAYRSALETLLNETALVESAPIVLCKWKAFEELAAVMKRRPLLPNFLHLANWPLFLAHCIAHRHYDVVRAHYPYAATVAHWNIEWPAQLAGLQRVAELEGDEASRAALSQWCSKSDVNAVLFELLQKPLAAHTLRLLDEPLDANWYDPGSGQTLLHASCQNVDVRLVTKLLSVLTVAHFRWRGHNGRSPFHAAAACGNEPVLLWLLEQHRAGVYNVAPGWHAGMQRGPLWSALEAGVSPTAIERMARCHSQGFLKELKASLPSHLQSYIRALERQPTKCKANKTTRPKKRLRLS